MKTNKLRSDFGSHYDVYFKNGKPNPAGDLVSGGIGLPESRNDWWDTRKLWLNPFYSISLMFGSELGSYRNENGFACELSQNTFLLMFPDLKATYCPTIGTHWGEIYAGFSGELFDVIRNQEILNPAQPVWQIDQMEPWVIRLQKILQMPTPTTAIQTMYRATHFLDFLMELLQEAQPIQSSEPSNDWFFSACQMLTGDLHHTVTLQNIANELGMGYHAFRYYFTQRAGVPPMQYRQQERLKIACDALIQDIPRPCRDIAFDLGYIDSHHFSEHFKKHLKMTPTEFQKKHAKRKDKLVP